MKPKSNIPWNNFIMRKHGVKLREAIETQAVNQILKVRELKMTECAKWISKDVGTC